ncbi:MAG: sigma-54-dependent transcriptional regulator [Gemmatimonadota bacterium]
MSCVSVERARIPPPGHSVLHRFFPVVVGSSPGEPLPRVRRDALARSTLLKRAGPLAASGSRNRVQGGIIDTRTTPADELTGASSDARGRILVVEDDDVIRGFLVKLLEGEKYEVTAVATGEKALSQLEQRLFDVVLLDLNLPGMHGLNVLAAAPVTQTDAQFIVMTAFAEVETAVEALRSGAIHYLTKPLDPEHLLLIVDRTIYHQDLRREVAQLRRHSGMGARQRIIGKAPVLQRMFDMIERVAPTRSSVLISGDTGTGKELAARAIHDLSPRARKPFVPVNCSALTESLLESELFGHVKGAFTGAVANRRGLIEEAHGGTLFLDEVATISLPVQVKLLRVLQEKRITRVGGNTPIAADFRLIAATNVDLELEVAEGRFREDLFYRINVFPIRVPPLRERRSDIPLLSNYFRQRFAEENEVEPPAISAQTLSRMMEYDWPGNVRELENFVERSLIMYAGAPAIRFNPPGLREDTPERELLDRARRESWDLERLEREYILVTLESTGGHQSNAADILGIDRRTVYRKLKQYEEDGLSPQD